MRSLPLRVTVRALGDGKATLETEGGHAFTLSAGRLPQACEAGTALCLQLDDVVSWPLPEEERASLAAAMLNEMLTAP